MSEQEEYNENLDRHRLMALIGDLPDPAEFAVPDDFFSEQTKLILANCRLNDLQNWTQFETPDNYFEDAGNRMLAAIQAGDIENKAFFEEQQNEILTRVRLENLNLPHQEEFLVPAGYFEKKATQMLSGIAESKKDTPVIPFYKTAHARMWMGIAAAASIAFLAVMIWPQESPSVRQPSFSELLERTEIDENDLEYFATDEEYDDLLLSEIELLTDTLITDTLQTRPASAKEPLNPQKDKKNKHDIKPKDKKKTPSFDDLTEDEILEFLLEEGDDDLLEDL